MDDLCSPSTDKNRKLFVAISLTTVYQSIREWGMCNPRPERGMDNWDQGPESTIVNGHLGHT